MTDYSLAHLRAIALPPPELIRVAACAGYKIAGLRLIGVMADSPVHLLMSDPAFMRETKAPMAETSVGAMDIPVEEDCLAKVRSVVAIRAFSPWQSPWQCVRVRS